MAFPVKFESLGINIPTPTPAPNWGGPVACLGGPVARHVLVAVFPWRPGIHSPGIHRPVGLVGACVGGFRLSNNVIR